jgi:hypothetical protein
VEADGKDQMATHSRSHEVDDDGCHTLTLLCNGSYNRTVNITDRQYKTIMLCMSNSSERILSNFPLKQSSMEIFMSIYQQQTNIESPN